MIHTIELKTAPELKDLVRQAFPSYRRLKVMLSEFGPGGANINSYWDGGRRSEHAIVEIATGKRKPLPTASHPYFDIQRAGLSNQETADVVVDRVGNVTLKVLPEGYALVTAGTFCGKPATAHIRLNPANMTKFLTA